jgi:hypothetical protein
MSSKSLIAAAVVAGGLCATGFADQMVLEGGFGNTPGGNWNLAPVSPWVSGASQFLTYYDVPDTLGYGWWVQSLPNYGEYWQAQNKTTGPESTGQFLFTENTQYDLSAELKAWCDNSSPATARARLYGFDAGLGWTVLADAGVTNYTADGINTWVTRTDTFMIGAGGFWAGKWGLVVIQSATDATGYGHVGARFDNISLTTTLIPEPASLAMMVFGLAGVLLLRRRMR